MESRQRLAELHTTCTVGEFNKEEGIVYAKSFPGSPPIVAVTLIETLGSENGSRDPVEVMLDCRTL